MAELASGDRIVAVNGRTDLEDLFDWQFELAGSDAIELLIQRAATPEEQEIIEFEFDSDSLGAEDPEEAVGIVFKSPLFTPIKTCNNACPFCFIDQQPEGLRSSLYVKDDDWRLSHFNQTYITLTNLTDRDRSRMAAIRPGPLYVSVHSTVPEVRIKMLKNPKFAGKIMDDLRWLQSLGIPFHAQVVLCPGINDGAALDQTLTDLHSLAPECLSVAVIPVGLTQYRDGLDPLESVDATVASTVVNQVEGFWASHPGAQEQIFVSDEFYHKAGRPLPTYEAYGEFSVLEDGVGTARSLIDSFFELESSLPKTIEPFQKVLVLTGKLAAMTLDPILRRLNEIDGLYLDCLPIESRFWGDAVDVAGLVTGQDILDATRISRYRALDAILATRMH
jgi:putative radical SAM enzyme (TIGR03279 family)